MKQSPVAVDSKQRELISFRVGAQEFCVEIMAVREIRSWTDVTPLPHAPPYVRGMINLRGTVLPVIDMGPRLNIPVDDQMKRRVIIVVWIGGKLVGLIVDAVCDILALPEEAIHASPELAGATIQDFISAVLTVEDRMLCLISLDRLVPELSTAAA